MPGRKGTILLVDDDPAILLSIGDQLELEGYRVVSASSAEQAIQKLPEVRPDLIVLDISMPGVGGMAFLREITTPAGATKYPVLVFTVRVELAAFFSSLGVDGFLPKTSDPETLLREVSRIISKSFRGDGGTEERGAGHRILLAEDDADVRTELLDFFTRSGHQAWGVDSGLALLEAVRQHHPTVILLKYILPRMNGPTVAQMLAGMPSTRSLPIVLYDDSKLYANTLAVAHVRTFVPTGNKKALLKAIEEVA